ncbi:MAG: DUF1489 family protein [Alphaproteobacteria bacterium]|nr:DUF1489 family protein [Alphaproteobacteria bacterium]MBV9373118.1 DUF1489 family protein [Alphaproteobacteria bacterium]MBV9902852.1 DUF1489 family protein [Alphaproteobacteria bacterium]
MREKDESQPLHISKVAVGCASVEALRRRQALRVADGEVPLVTRFRPKRADELVGGSVFWIVKHRITARQTILGFAQREEDRKTVIRLSPELVPVKTLARRAHQGWRYLPASEAPADLDGDDSGLAELPARLTAKLAALLLI